MAASGSGPRPVGYETRSRPTMTLTAPSATMPRRAPVSLVSPLAPDPRLFRSAERSGTEAELEIAVLRHQLGVLRRQVKHPSTGPPTRPFSQQRVGSFPERPGAHSSFAPRRSFDGTAGSWRGSGRSATGAPDDRPSILRPGAWSFAWPERTRGGGTSGSKESSSAWGSRSRRQPSPRSSGRTASAPLPDEGRRGGSSSASRRGESSPSTSSLWKTVWLKTLYALVFLELGTRRVHVARATGAPIRPGSPSRPHRRRGARGPADPRAVPDP